MKKTALLFVLTILLNALAFGEDVFLVKATNDEDSEVTNLYLALDEKKDIVEFKVKSFQGDKLVEDQAYSIDQGEEGIVLERQKGRDIVTLYSDNFSGHHGGDIVMEFLYNGITGSHDELDLNLARNADKWDLYIKGKKVTHIHFVSNKKWMVGTIGVKTVRVIR